MENYPPIIHKPRSFLSTLALGASGIVMMLILSGAAIILYGMNIADRKSTNLVELVQSGLANLPELQKRLPPAFADLLNDQRRPEYLEKIQLTVRLVAPDGDRGGIHPIIEVVNQGGSLITLLSARVVILDADGRPVTERNEWLATPVAADRDWRGPLMPNSSRMISCQGFFLNGRNAIGPFSARVEVSDLRLWKEDAPRVQAKTFPL